MNMKKANILGSCILILICAGLGVQVMNIKEGTMVDLLGPRFFPGLILAIIVALSILVIALTIRSKEGVDTAFATRGGIIYAVLTLVIFAAYIAGLAILGYAVPTALFLFVLSTFFYGHIDKKVITIAVFAVLSTLAVYLLFTYVFSIRLPRGVI